jgi:hypothetical protein
MMATYFASSIMTAIMWTRSFKNLVHTVTFDLKLAIIAAITFNEDGRVKFTIKCKPVSDCLFRNYDAVLQSENTLFNGSDSFINGSWMDFSAFKGQFLLSLLHAISLKRINSHFDAPDNALVLEKLAAHYLSPIRFTPRPSGLHRMLSLRRTPSIKTNNSNSSSIFAHTVKRKPSVASSILKADSQTQSIRAASFQLSICRSNIIKPRHNRAVATIEINYPPKPPKNGTLARRFTNALGLQQHDNTVNQLKNFNIAKDLIQVIKANHTGHKNLYCAAADQKYVKNTVASLLRNPALGISNFAKHGPDVAAAIFMNFMYKVDDGCVLMPDEAKLKIVSAVGTQL